MNVYEMEGFLRGKCLPGDMLVGESHAEYLVRKLKESATIKAERDALAVENAALKSAHPQPFGPEMMKALDAYEKHQDEVPETGMLDAFFILRDSIRVETPATDAALAAIEARGAVAAIESLISRKELSLAEMHPDTHAYGATQETVRNQIYDLELFAAELREAK